MEPNTLQTFIIILAAFLVATLFYFRCQLMGGKRRRPGLPPEENENTDTENVPQPLPKPSINRMLIWVIVVLAAALLVAIFYR